MTREEITALAREAGFIEMGGQHGALRRFAQLVQAREREACALMAYSVEARAPGGSWRETIAAAIRNREP